MFIIFSLILKGAFLEEEESSRCSIWSNIHFTESGLKGNGEAPGLTASQGWM